MMAAPAEKKIILFIDDNPMDRAFIDKLLTKNNFKVLLAEDGEVGLCMAQEYKIDLILLDILLPHISGIELCKELKKIPATKNIPVIFYSSIETPKNMMVYVTYGALDYIQKSMPPRELIDSIKTILKLES
jgi:DNA-binding response OmpR family regulator